MKRSLTLVFLVLTMLFWAINFFAIKIALDYYSAIAVAFWRFLFGVAVLLVVVSIQYGKGLAKIRLTFKILGYVGLVSFFGIFLTIYFLNEGLQTTSAINGTLIMSINPVVTAVLAYIFLHRQFDSRQLLAISLCILGVIILLVKGDLELLLSMQFESGDLYILGMALVFSISQIIVDKYLSSVNAILMTTIGAFLALLMFAGLSTPELLATPLPTDARFWSSVLFMGVLGTGVGYVSFYYAVMKLGATTTSLYGNLIPLLTILLATPFGEEIFPAQLVGGFVVIVGLMLFGQSKKN